MRKALEAEGLGKEYVLGSGALAGGTLYETLASGTRRLLRGGSARAPRERFWALRDVGFDVRAGEVLGVIGRNGAGKSTLLKILSRIAAPTTGRVIVRGNLASLLEVGTGFHPELTGRENIYLNGVILGMSRREIDRKFDEIVAFAEVERFLETPVKRYSSGMYVRLAFAVAAHLDADVLLVDEVLAVGDLAFQRKSLGKMGEVAQGGRTVIFVSHNLGAVRSLCDSILLLDAGRVLFRGPTGEGIEAYESRLLAPGAAFDRSFFAGPLTDRLHFSGLEIRQAGGRVTTIDPRLPFEIAIRGEALADLSGIQFAFGVERDSVRLFSAHDDPEGKPLSRGPFAVTFRVPAAVLRPGRFTLGVGAQRPANQEWLWAREAALLEVSEHWHAAMQAKDEGAMQVDVRATRST